MGNDDASRTETVTAHPHNDSWAIISLNIHKLTLDHLQHPQLTFYNPYSLSRKLTEDPWTLLLQENRKTM